VQQVCADSAGGSALSHATNTASLVCRAMPYSAWAGPAFGRSKAVTAGGGIGSGAREQAASDNAITAQEETPFMAERKKNARSDGEAIIRPGVRRNPGSAGCN